MLTRLRVLAARTKAFFMTSTLDRDFESELESHLAMLAEENVRRGMTPEEARRAARLEMGGLDRARELHRETRGLPVLAALVQDVRYALRSLRRDAGFATFAILTVGLGIGASSTIYSVVDALLRRPLPFSDPGRLVWMANAGTEGPSVWTIQIGHFLDLRERNRSFSGLAAYHAFYSAGGTRLTETGDPERLTSVPVTTDFFSFLGVRPQLGRLFNADEGQAQWHRPQVALLSYGLWKRRFAADPAIVGQKLTLDGSAVTVVGVLPESFDFAAVFAPGDAIDLFFPLPLTAEADSRGNTISVLGRLKPGVTVESAQAELSALAKQISEQHPRRNRLEPIISPLGEHVSGPFRRALAVLGCAVAAVMLIVCANLSSLLLARATTRQQEMAIRAALGAGHGRLLRQMLTESLVLAAGGALLGIVLALAGTRALARLDAFRIPLLESVRIDAGALAFTLLLALLTGLIFGLVPALQAALTVALHDSLKDGSRGSSHGKRRAWLREAMVVSEVVFACVLLVGSGLLMRSFLRVLDVTLGYRPASTVALRIDPNSRYATQAQRNAYFDEALRRVRAMPGVEAASLTDVLPLGGDRSWGVAAKGQTTKMDEDIDAFVRIVSDGHLQAMGIPLRAGRDFTARDSLAGERVVLVNETLARRLWPGQDPIGREITQDGGRRVVGVVGDVRHRALELSAGGEMYLPLRQTDDYDEVDLVVRTALAPAALAAAVRSELMPIAPDLPKGEFRTLQQLVDKAVSPRRFVVLLIGGFSAFALILAALGIYAVISYGVGQRTRELGIRAALGASARDLRARILLETLGLAGVGMLLGVIVAAGLARALRGLLFGVTAGDPVTFFGILVLLAAVAALAGYLPARRASRIDPMTALR
jgi:predicted permease